MVPATAAPGDIDVQLLAVNDFHGRIEVQAGGDGGLITDPGPDGQYGTDDDIRGARRRCGEPGDRRESADSRLGEQDVDSCFTDSTGDTSFGGANFPYLAANVVYNDQGTDPGEPILPPYQLLDVGEGSGWR